MATLKEIKDRKVSVTSINKITSALKLVSTAKSQRKLKDLRMFEPYFLKLIFMIDMLQKERDTNKYTTSKDKTFWIVFTSDMGLAGGFNSLLIKEFAKQFDLKEDRALVFGSKGAQLINSRMNVPENHIIFERSEDFGDTVNQLLAKSLLKRYEEDGFDIKVISNSYINQITTEIKISQLLPLNFKNIDLENNVNKQIIFEPSIEKILLELINFYLESSLNYFYKDSITAEETSRRTAMENATTNSEDMIKDLTKQFNKIRQSKITQEISELISGSE